MPTCVAAVNSWTFFGKGSEEAVQKHENEQEDDDKYGVRVYGEV